MKITEVRISLKESIWIRKISLTIIIMIVTQACFCQTKDSTSLSNRIKNLEDYRANLEQLYQISAAKLDSSLDSKIDAKVKDIDDAKKELNLLIFLGLPLTALGIISAYWIAINKAKKFVVDKIESLVQDKREEIIKLIESQEYESRLRKKKRLLVLSSDEDSQEQIKLLIGKLKFSRTEYRIITNHETLEGYDLIIFNDYYKVFEQELITEYLEKAVEEHINFVAYTNRKLIPHQRLNFSNSRYTLFHSILSTLKYAEILKSEEV